MRRIIKNTQNIVANLFTLTHSQALQPMQGLGRLKKPPPIISTRISGPGPLIPDSQLLCILRPMSFRSRCFFTGAGC